MIVVELKCRCESNCKLDIDPSMELLLRIPCQSESWCIVNSGVTFWWEIKLLCSSFGDPSVPAIDWARDTLSGNTHDRLIIKADVFKRSVGRKTYEIDVRGMTVISTTDIVA